MLARKTSRSVLTHTLRHNAPLSLPDCVFWMGASVSLLKQVYPTQALMAFISAPAACNNPLKEIQSILFKSTLKGRLPVGVRTLITLSLLYPPK